MKKLILSTIIAATMFSGLASAEYVMHIPLEKSMGGTLPDGTIKFVAAPVEPETPSLGADCTISNDDFIPFGGQLLGVWAEPGMDCVVSVEVPKSVFDGACNADSYPATVALWDMMRSKGVDGLSSMSYSGECDGSQTPVVEQPIEEEPVAEQPTNPTYDMALSIYVRDSGNNSIFNGVSVDGMGNAESSYFNMSNDTFFLAKEYESYFWRDGQHLDYIPNVGGYIQFDGKAQDCIIASLNESAAGTTYQCDRDINFAADSNEVINVIFARRTN